MCASSKVYRYRLTIFHTRKTHFYMSGKVESLGSAMRHNISNAGSWKKIGKTLKALYISHTQTDKVRKTFSKKIL